MEEPSIGSESYQMKRMLSVYFLPLGVLDEIQRSDQLRKNISHCLGCQVCHLYEARGIYQELVSDKRLHSLSPFYVW